MVSLSTKKFSLMARKKRKTNQSSTASQYLASNDCFQPRNQTQTPTPPDQKQLSKTSNEVTPERYTPQQEIEGVEQQTVNAALSPVSRRSKASSLAKSARTSATEPTCVIDRSGSGSGGGSWEEATPNRSAFSSSQDITTPGSLQQQLGVSPASAARQIEANGSRLSEQSGPKVSEDVKEGPSFVLVPITSPSKRSVEVVLASSRGHNILQYENSDQSSLTSRRTAESGEGDVASLKSPISPNRDEDGFPILSSEGVELHDSKVVADELPGFEEWNASISSQRRGVGEALETESSTLDDVLGPILSPKTETWMQSKTWGQSMSTLRYLFDTRTWTNCEHTEIIRGIENSYSSSTGMDADEASLDESISGNQNHRSRNLGTARFSKRNHHAVALCESDVKSDFTGVSTQIATNRTVDVALKRLRSDVPRPPQPSSHSEDEFEPPSLRRAISPGDTQPVDVTRPIPKSHPVRYAFGAALVNPKQLEAHSLLSVSSNDSSRNTPLSQVIPNVDRHTQESGLTLETIGETAGLPTGRLGKHVQNDRLMSNIVADESGSLHSSSISSSLGVEINAKRPGPHTQNLAQSVRRRIPGIPSTRADKTRPVIPNNEENASGYRQIETRTFSMKNRGPKKDVSSTCNEDQCISPPQIMRHTGTPADRFSPDPVFCTEASSPDHASRVSSTISGKFASPPRDSSPTPDSIVQDFLHGRNARHSESDLPAVQSALTSTARTQDTVSPVQRGVSLPLRPRSVSGERPEIDMPDLATPGTVFVGEQSKETSTGSPSNRLGIERPPSRLARPSSAGIAFLTAMSIFEQSQSATHSNLPNSGPSNEKCYTKISSSGLDSLLAHGKRTSASRFAADNISVDVSSLKSAYESIQASAGGAGCDGQDDDSVSVRSIRDRYEPPRKKTEKESRVSKMRAMFEPEIHRGGSRFDATNGPLRDSISKFDSRTLSPGRVSSHRKVHDGIKPTSRAVIQDTSAPDAQGALSVADRIRAFNSVGVDHYSNGGTDVAIVPKGIGAPRDVKHVYKRQTQNMQVKASQPIDIRVPVAGRVLDTSGRQSPSFGGQEEPDMPDQSHEIREPLDIQTAFRPGPLKFQESASVKPSLTNTVVKPVAIKPGRGVSASSFSEPLTPSGLIRERIMKFASKAKEEDHKQDHTNPDSRAKMDSKGPTARTREHVDGGPVYPIIPRTMATVSEKTHQASSAALSGDQKNRFRGTLNTRNVPALSRDEIEAARQFGCSPHHDDSDSSESESEFSDGVTLDVSIADVSCLTYPTALCSRNGDKIETGEGDESVPSSKSVDLTEMDAKRSEASSSQTSEAAAPLIARAMRLLPKSDEMSASSFFAKRAEIANQWSNTSGWDDAIIPQARQSESPKSPAPRDLRENEMGNEGDSSGWDVDKVDSLFPVAASKSATDDMFDFDSEWRAFSTAANDPQDEAPSLAARSEEAAARKSPRSRTPTRSNTSFRPIAQSMQVSDKRRQQQESPPVIKPIPSRSSVLQPSSLTSSSPKLSVSTGDSNGDQMTLSSLAHEVAPINVADIPTTRASRRANGNDSLTKRRTGVSPSSSSSSSSAARGARRENRVKASVIERLPVRLPQSQRRQQLQVATLTASNSLNVGTISSTSGGSTSSGSRSAGHRHAAELMARLQSLREARIRRVAAYTSDQNGAHSSPFQGIQRLPDPDEYSGTSNSASTRSSTQPGGSTFMAALEVD